MCYGRCARAHTYRTAHAATAQSPMMALAAIFIVFTLAVHSQISFGQLLNKIAAPHSSQQQSHKSITETMINTDNVGNTKTVQLLASADFNQPNVNKTVAFLKGNTISNIKFVRNQAHDVPVSSPAISMIKGSGTTPQSSQGNFRSVFINANPIADHLNATAPTTIKHPEMNAGSLSQSPFYITLGSPPLTSSPSQTSFLTNVQPMLSSVQFVPNPVKLQTAASPVPTQVPHQTFATLHIPPTNVPNQAKLLYAQMPPAAPPARPTAPPPDTTVQSRHSLTSLLLSHLLSPSSNAEDPSIPITNHYTYRNSKPSNIKALLPLLLDLLNERNNDCCECGKYQRYNKCKPQKMHRRFRDNSHDIYSKPSTEQRFAQAWRSDTHSLKQDSVEEEDYSDEMSDYSGEYYNDD